MIKPQIEERIKQAYITPIRTVLAIDDEFPSYGVAPDGKQLTRAKAIWQACRNRGLLCDIDDGASLVGGVTPEHLKKSDLVILDYHLQEGDSRHSLDLLVQLSESDHASLVVVYTKDKELDAIRRKISAHLRGRKSVENWVAKPEERQAWDSIQAKLGDLQVAETVIDAFIGGKLKECSKDQETRQQIEKLGVAKPLVSACIYALLEVRLQDLTKRTAVNDTPPPVVGASVKSPWVYANNLFVVCVNKTPENENDGELVFAELLTALCDWNPNFMFASLAFARAEFMRGGFRYEREALNDPNLQAGWLYHAWAGSEHEQKDRLRTLFERVINGYATRLIEGVIEFGTDLVPTTESPTADRKTLRAAIDQFHDEAGNIEPQVMHQLNSFLVIEQNRNFIETGTIFVRNDDTDMKQVYVCVTPACDLVPRVPKDYLWEKQIHPSRPIIAIRGRLKGMDETCLGSAEQGKNIFLMLGNEPKTIVLMDSAVPVPVLEWFVVDKMGAIEKNEFKALEFIKQEADEQFANKPVTMKVLGQVRALYASRIQQYAGQHLSRIGVDFVGLPEQSKPEKSSKAASASGTAAPAPAAKSEKTSATSVKNEVVNADPATRLDEKASKAASPSGATALTPATSANDDVVAKADPATRLDEKSK